MADLDFSPLPERKPLMSITLPRNFAPTGLDGLEEPRTPDQTFAELKLPPPPHHSTLRIRRPRINLDNFQARNNALPATLFASDIPIPSSAVTRHMEEPRLPSVSYSFDVPLPSIEVPSPQTVYRPTYHHGLPEPSSSERLRLPPFREQAPKTPPAQMKPAAQSEFKPNAWDMERSSSVSSNKSDSSFSSCDTFTTRPTSFNGSVTSPETDLRDPFSPTKFNLIPDTPSRKSKKIRLETKPSKHGATWTVEMDNHLFNVYQMYLGDPTVTPFKTVPGSIPPTGVCHRVARRARLTWPRASMIPMPIVKRYKLRDVLENRNAVLRDKTPEPNDFLRLRHDSPSAANDGRGRWPSESATRKRLKLLCKQKFTISAHYQRLRESRSPSPFTDQFTRRPSGITRSMSRPLETHPSTSQLSRELSAPTELRSPTTFATRELGISLVASGATAPLAQLVTGDSPDIPQPASDEWFNTPVITPSEDKMNISPPSGLGIDPNSLAPASSIPRLASPFTYSTWNGPTRSTRGHRRQVSQNQFDTVHATGSRLLSPFRIEPDMSSNANKRRAQHNLEDELSPSGSHIEPKAPTQELVFTGVGDISHRRIRLRNRGATLGAATNQERLDRLFSPPPPTLPQTQGDLSSSNTTSQPFAGLAPPELDDRQKRLGSPFELDPNKRSNRSRAPRHVPSLSDPFVVSNPFMSATSGAGASNPSVQSIEERLAQFQAMHQGGLFGLPP